ncbi:MAG: nucleotidyltransferase domain-containing protein [Candidatus Melainabacteria bacterium]|mgnify:CR=1 FL=1|jgi:uncharacterized protein|nr:nucleotidyltransferase domain-containing protein [Candidatus Melainabacteria bacterium]
MRLNSKQVKTIKDASKAFLPGADVFLFGSRLDDKKLGGDIDLLINTKSKPDRKVKHKIRHQIWESIGEQKIDIVFDYPGNDSSFTELVKLEMQKL